MQLSHFAYTVFSNIILHHEKTLPDILARNHGVKIGEKLTGNHRVSGFINQLEGDARPLTDATIDRIAHNRYRINIKRIDAEHDISVL